MAVAFWVRRAGLTQNDDACWTTIDAQCATGAHVVIDDEDHIVGRIRTGHIDRFGFSNCIRISEA
jgi:hypothetical protein